MRCSYDRKTVFKSRKLATRTARRLPDTDNRIYWCQHSGGWHLTRYENGEYSRRQARKYNRNGMEERVEQVEQEIAAVQAAVGRGGDCPKCGWLHGFHDPILHSYHDVPRYLTWKPGEPAPWEKEQG